MDLPKFEALNLDEPDFIVDPNTQNVCFLPLPIFTRISEMLSPSDFYNLAQTCRYMHWRMFTYGHLMLKHHLVWIDHYGKESKIREVATIEGRYRKDSEIIASGPYVYFEYLHLEFGFSHYSPFIFDKMIDYVSKAKKRTKHYCIRIFDLSEECTQQTFEDINNLIERMNPLHLDLRLVWNDHKLPEEIPNIKNVYSVALFNAGRSRETEFHMNPCADYTVYTAQDLRDIVQEFIKNSRLQFHICRLVRNVNAMECRAMLEKEWNLKFEEADETLLNHFYFSESNLIPFYASIPSEHGNVEIFFLGRTFVIQRKETVIGQWKDFYRNVRM